MGARHGGQGRGVRPHFYWLIKKFRTRIILRQSFNPTQPEALCNCVYLYWSQSAPHPSPSKLHYEPLLYTVEHNGHTIQATPAESVQALHLGDKVFALKQFHFHTPSEHTFLSKYFPMEAHFVHQSEAGELAVLAVMFEEGKENPALAPLLAKKLQAGEKEKLAEKLDVMPLFPEGQSHFRLNGSLTTPPCTEGVNWVVFKTAVNASKAQLDAMRDMIGQANNRPVQPLNARLVIEE